MPGRFFGGFRRLASAQQFARIRFFPDSTMLNHHQTNREFVFPTTLSKSKLFVWLILGEMKRETEINVRPQPARQDFEGTWIIPVSNWLITIMVKKSLNGLYMGVILATYYCNWDHPPSCRVYWTSPSSAFSFQCVLLPVRAPSSALSFQRISL